MIYLNELVPSYLGVGLNKFFLLHITFLWTHSLSQHQRYPDAYQTCSYSLSFNVLIPLYSQQFVFIF